MKIPVSFQIPFRLMFGLLKPKKTMRILGQELSGEVVSVGAQVTQFRTGDPVFAVAEKFGAYAGYVCLSDKNTTAPKPDNMSFEEAATVPVGGLNALHFVWKALVGEGQKVLIHGAAGSIGTFAVQLAKLSGAEVTAVDCTSKLDMLRSIGADQVIDYTREDFTRTGKTYDVIIDIAGKSPYFRSVKSLNPKGRYLLGNPRFIHFFKKLWTSVTSDKNVIIAMTGYRTEDLNFLRELIEAGKLRTVIDKRFALEQIVEAHRYVETGQKAGHVVLTVS